MKKAYRLYVQGSSFDLNNNFTFNISFQCINGVTQLFKMAYYCFDIIIFMLMAEMV